MSGPLRPAGRKVAEVDPLLRWGARDAGRPPLHAALEAASRDPGEEFVELAPKIRWSLDRLAEALHLRAR